MSSPAAGLRLRRWRDPAVLAVAVVAFAAGFGQFGVVAALGHVAQAFGQTSRSGLSLQEEAGLSGTTLGVGLAVIRLASLGGLPLAGLADRLGRVRTLVTSCASGLLLTAAAAASPSFWWFVAIFAIGRPALSATTALSTVVGAEQTASEDRAKAVALMAAAYAVGAGSTAVLNSLAGDALGFRGLFVLAVVPLVVLPVVARRAEEPDRFRQLRPTQTGPAPTGPALPVLGAVARPFRRRLGVVVALAFAVSVVTGPANSFTFLYAQDVLHLSGLVTASMVVASGALGLGGLLVGRVLADRLGRRPTAATAMAGIVAAAVLAYSGSAPGLVLGYIAGVTAGALFAPGAGALANELLPTPVRASVAGWQVAAQVLGGVVGLVCFGALESVAGRFADAALVTFLPVLLSLPLFLLLPETRGTEPEALWPTEAPEPSSSPSPRGAGGHR
ncbi:MFS transporter [Aciditerrimonas ferrireducens]|uniref:MFS transporter n=1 Tax=Aciditerrimonas ferrireducens TaxID=667306 RepID=A0ABV6C2G2_9ACTN